MSVLISGINLPKLPPFCWPMAPFHKIDHPCRHATECKQLGREYIRPGIVSHFSKSDERAKTCPNFKNH
jgi:hypothetical protein